MHRYIENQIFHPWWYYASAISRVSFCWPILGQSRSGIIHPRSCIFNSWSYFQLHKWNWRFYQYYVGGCWWYVWIANPSCNWSSIIYYQLWLGNIIVTCQPWNYPFMSESLWWSGMELYSGFYLQYGQYINYPITFNSYYIVFQPQRRWVSRVPLLEDENWIYMHCKELGVKLVYQWLVGLILSINNIYYGIN